MGREGTRLMPRWRPASHLRSQLALARRRPFILGLRRRYADRQPLNRSTLTLLRASEQAYLLRDETHDIPWTKACPR